MRGFYFADFKKKKRENSEILSTRNFVHVHKTAHIYNLQAAFL